MATKVDNSTKSIRRRQPLQARAQHKVALIFEAAQRILDAGDIDSLTTNAVAEKAGVSIGTLYQYFNGKDALLDALVATEINAMSENVLAAMSKAPTAPGERVRFIVHAVVRAYGGRGRVHRILIERGLSRSPGKHLLPLYKALFERLEIDGLAMPQGAPRKITSGQGFVLVHAMAGVLRALASAERTPPRQEIEDALVLLVWRFLTALPATES